MSTLEKIKSKIFDVDALKRQLAVWRFQSKTIVFTNGCFDLLHLGHIDYLSKASDEGDILIVGVNTDASTSKLKGPHRPINNETQRSMILASLSFVDAVVLFNEDTPYDLIKTIKPDVLIKGGDYTVKDIVGADVVQENGGITKTIELLAGYSTTLTEEKIRLAKK
jgi:D-glycero-beta-D-manno-heptose 1-phosphate adenylyltransferase